MPAPTTCRATRRHLVVRAMRAAFDADGRPAARAAAARAPTSSRTPAASARRRRRSSPASCWPAGWWPGAALLLDDDGAVPAGRPDRGPPRQRRARASTAASRSPVATRTASSTRSARRSTRGSRRSCSCRRPRSRPRSPAGCCPTEVPHADAAAERRSYGAARRRARRPARAAAARDPRLPAPGLPATRRCPTRLDLVDALRADGVPAVVSGAGPTVLAFTDAARRRRACSARCPDGWAGHQLEVETAGAPALLTGVILQHAALECYRRGTVGREAGIVHPLPRLRRRPAAPAARRPRHPSATAGGEALTRRRRLEAGSALNVGRTSRDGNHRRHHRAAA